MKWWATRYQDLFAVDLDPSHTDIRDQLSDSPDMSAVLKSHARTLWDGDKVLGVVGLWPLHKGVGLAWTLLSSEAKSHPMTLHRGVIEFLLEAETMGYWRIQSTVEVRFEKHRQWLVRLGFVYEGRMRCYGPDRKDHDLYARVRY